MKILAIAALAVCLYTGFAQAATTAPATALAALPDEVLRQVADRAAPDWLEFGEFGFVQPTLD